MQCTNPFFLRSQGFFVPCGKCLACRIAKRREWSLRLTHQMTVQPDCIFLTLTYNDDNLPKDGNINKRSVQLFMKRFRKRFGRGIKYFLCGEYGDDTFRPHYHSIIFGVGLQNYLGSCQSVISFFRHGFRYFSVISDIWPYGYCVVSSVSVDTISYVCGYVTKKIRGSLEKYKKLGLKQMPFQLQSQGLGLDFILQENQSFRLQREMFTYFKGHKCSLPRYYRKKLSIIGEDMKPLVEKSQMEVFKKLLDKGKISSHDMLYRNVVLPDFYFECLKQQEATLFSKENLFNRRSSL
uniref:Replication initiator protein n=1 Tax=Dulem virus 101 TaxID=3145578 RepID=A0AAU8BA49_9VIRU